MSYLLRLFGYGSRRKAVRSGEYGEEVLFAGWVDLPAGFREIIARP